MVDVHAQNLSAGATRRRPAGSVTDASIARSRLIDEQSNPAPARMTIRISVGLVLAFFLWAALTPLHELTVSSGTILPEGFVQDIGHLEGGIVAEVLVSDGDAVEEGAPLIRLDDIATRSELAKATARLESLSLAVDRLNAFVENRSVELESSSSIGAILANQKAVQASRLVLRESQLAVIAAEVSTRQTEIEDTRRQIEIADLETSLLKAREADYLKAFNRGAVSRREYETVVREKLEVEGARVRLLGQIGRIESSLLEARAREMELRSQQSTDALEDLAQLETERLETLALVEQLQDQVGRTTIKSPVAGTVQSLSVRGRGAVINRGDIVARIVPEQETVFAQVEVPAEGIGYVTPGMPAQVKVSAYDFARFGGVDGVIDQVSPTNERTEDGRYVFNAKIRLESQFVGPEQENRAIRPGMTVVADVRSGQKSVLSYLLKPLRSLSDGALTER